MTNGILGNVFQRLQAWGVLDIMLPFILIFTITFAVVSRLEIFKKKKNYAVVIALSLSLITVIPHVTGDYPPGYDVVEIINTALPSVSLLAIAGVMVLFMLGLFSLTMGKNLTPIIGLVAMGMVVYIFGAAINIWPDYLFWVTPEVQELILVLLVFGIVVWFITKEEGKGSTTEDIGKFMQNMFKGAGGN